MLILLQINICYAHYTHNLLVVVVVAAAAAELSHHYEGDVEVIRNFLFTYFLLLQIVAAFILSHVASYFVLLHM